MGDVINTMNKQMVAVQGRSVVVMLPVQRMTYEEAMVHAAWIVSMAEAIAPSDGDRPFTSYLEAVQGT